MQLRFFFVIFPLLQFFYAPNSSALTLKEGFESALATNFGDNINQTLINQEIERKKQNTGNLFPKLALKGTYLKQDNVNADQVAVGLNLTHSLYKGGRDSLLLKTTDKNITLLENQKKADQLTLYLSVIQAYYNYFLNLNDYKNLELLKKQSKERVDETKKRVHVGQSRKGDLLQAEAQLALVEAQVFNVLGLIKESEDNFYILTGLDKRKNVFTELIQIPNESKLVQAYIDSAFDRFDVKNKEQKIEFADLEIMSSKTLYYPTLDLASNYYFNKKSFSSFKKSQWDLGLTLMFPLFEAGVTSAKVTESIQKKEQAIFTLSQYKHSIELDITAKYETYHRFLDQTKAFDQAFEKAKYSYEEGVKDYRLGLISNLDLLSSLNLYLDSKRNSEKTKIQAMMNLKILEASSGVLP